MIDYLSKVLYILGERRKRLPILLILFLISSLSEAFGVGMIGSFIQLTADPDSMLEISILSWLYKFVRAQSIDQFIVIFGLLIIGVFLLKSLFYFIIRVTIFNFSFSQRKILVSKLLNAYLNVPYTFHLKQSSANLTKNIVVETNKFSSACLLKLLDAIANLLIIVVLFILLIRTDAVLMLTILGFFLPVFLLFYFLRKKFVMWGRLKSQSQKRMIQIINHSLGGLKETRVLGCEGYFQNQIDKQGQVFSRAATLFNSSQIVPRISIEAALICVVIAAIIINQYLANDSSQNFAATLGVFSIASIRLIPSTTQLMQSIGMMQNAKYALDMLYLDLKALEERDADLQRLNPDRLKASERLAFDREIKIQNLTFSYPEASRPSIVNLSMSIRKGESVALIGKSGAGKTTLVDILLGLLTPEQGDIKVDDVSVYRDLRSWQNLMGYIPQSIFLTEDSIKRNVAFGVPNHSIDVSKVMRVLDAVQLGDFIEQLPEGIDTKVGERGVRLSGGQRQRIGIARALYHDREILILDEATSALDTETEVLVNEAIKSLAGVKTLIIIAHRLSTVEHCDRLFELKEGQVINSGSYHEVVVGDDLSASLK